MRTLASIGLFARAGGARYVLTPIGERLCSDRPGSLRQLFIAETDPVHLLKFVLHDWNDQDASRVLRSCRAAIAAEGASPHRRNARA
jgi:hypothetical protein